MVKSCLFGLALSSVCEPAAGLLLPTVILFASAACQKLRLVFYLMEKKPVAGKNVIFYILMPSSDCVNRCL